MSSEEFSMSKSTIFITPEEQVKSVVKTESSDSEIEEIIPIKSATPSIATRKNETKKTPKSKKTTKTVNNHIRSSAEMEKIIEGLPKETEEGKEITWMDKEIYKTQYPDVAKMDALPLKKQVVIKSWKEVKGKFGLNYIMYTDDTKDITSDTQAYWSNSRATGILAAQLVDPSSQYLVITRIAPYEYVYGTVCK